MKGILENSVLAESDKVRKGGKSNVKGAKLCGIEEIGYPLREHIFMTIFTCLVL